MTIRKIVMIVDTDLRLSAAIAARPGVEIHYVAVENEIDMALLNDLHSPCKLAFVGGDVARRFAGLYVGTWIADSATFEDDLLRLWSESV